MSKNDDKPQAVKQAEKTGGETFDPKNEPGAIASVNDIPDAEKCPDCEGRGIRNPDVDRQVCQTCGGSGRGNGIVTTGR